MVPKWQDYRCRRCGYWFTLHDVAELEQPCECGATDWQQMDMTKLPPDLAPIFESCFADCRGGPPPFPNPKTTTQVVADKRNRDDNE